MSEETELAEIWWEPIGYQRKNFDHYIVGQQGVDRIVLRADGHGLSGHYDRIHVYQSNEKVGALKDTDHFVFPAHFVHGWKQLDTGD